MAGSATGSGFKHTNQLKVMNYNESVTTDEAEWWDEYVVKEHNTFKKYEAWEAVRKSKVPADAKVLTLIWAMKPKANRVKKARLNVRGFKQINGIHYNSQDISAPVVNNATIQILLVLIIMANWTTALLDVKGAFLMEDLKMVKCYT
eukprot:11802496-Ditylum_brightwellii.AAC.1